MWYKHLRDFLIDQGFKTNEVCPHIFIKRIHPWLLIVAIYVDDLNLIGMVDAISFFQLKAEFEMKDLEETTLCLGLHVEHLARGIFLHQSL